MWSDDQKRALHAIRQWWNSGRKELVVGGLAGTGKTTIAAHLPRVLGLSRDAVAYCCYTGKAAQVLSNRLTTTSASTIHSLMYLPRQSHCRQCPASWADEPCRHEGKDCCLMRWERRDRLDPAVRLVVVDEASMVDETIYDDLSGYDVRIVWIGDHGQLPPVSGKFNLMDDPALRLEQIHRQAADSPILQLAMLARKGQPLPLGELGPNVRRTYEMSAEIGETPAARKRQLVLCWRNQTRIAVNALVRGAFGFPADRPVAGDRVICLRNNRHSGVFNGMLGTIENLRREGKVYLARIDLDDARRPYVGKIAADQFGVTGRSSVRGVDLFDYGYCLTVHKAQGSEADEVVLFDEYPEHKEDRPRWLYTAITRAKRDLTIIASP